MQRRGKLFPVFIIFLLLSLLFIGLSSQGMLGGMRGVLEGVTLPLQKLSFGIFAPADESESEKIQRENKELRAALAKQAELEKENRALRDQFETTKPSSQNLLPASVIGMPGFIPGVSVPDSLIIDQGEEESVQRGDIVVVKDSLIGIISQTSAHRSEVALISKKDSSFTAEAVKGSVPGILKGEGQGMLILGNVVLSDSLEKGSLVITSGDVSKEGKGYPPGLVVGKIVSVQKKQSELFQTAEVESLIDITKLQMVFILTNNE